MSFSNIFNKPVSNEAAFNRTFDSSQEFCQSLEILAEAKRFKYLCVAGDGKLTEVGLLTKLFEELKGMLGFTNNCGVTRVRTSLKWMVKCAFKRNWGERSQVALIHKIGVRANLLNQTAPSRSDVKFLKFMVKVNTFFNSKKHYIAPAATSKAATADRLSSPTPSLAPTMGTHSVAVVELDDEIVGAPSDRAAECLELVSASPVLVKGESCQSTDASERRFNVVERPFALSTVEADEAPSSSQSTTAALSLPEVDEQPVMSADGSHSSWLSSAAKGALFVSSIVAIGVAFKLFSSNQATGELEFDQREALSDPVNQSGVKDFTAENFTQRTADNSSHVLSDQATRGAFALGEQCSIGIDLRSGKSGVVPASEAANVSTMAPNERYRLICSQGLPTLDVVHGVLAKSEETNKQSQFDKEVFDTFLKSHESTELVDLWLKNGLYVPQIQARLLELFDEDKVSYKLSRLESALTSLFKRKEGKKIVTAALCSITQMLPDVKWPTTVVVQAIESNAWLDEIEAALANVFDPAREKSFRQLEIDDRHQLRTALNSLFNNGHGRVILDRAIENKQLVVLREASVPWCVDVLIKNLSSGKWQPEKADYLEIVGTITGLADNGLPFLAKAYRERDESVFERICVSPYYQHKLVDMMLAEGPIAPELDRRGNVVKDFYRFAFSFMLTNKKHFVGEEITIKLQEVLERALADGTVSIVEAAIENNFGIDLIRSAVVDGSLGKNNSDKQFRIFCETCDALYQHGALSWFERLRYCWSLIFRYCWSLI